MATTQATLENGTWGTNPAPRPGFDYSFSFVGQGVYVDPEFEENGPQGRHQRMGRSHIDG